MNKIESRKGHRKEGTDKKRFLNSRMKNYKKKWIRKKLSDV